MLTDEALLDLAATDECDMDPGQAVWLPRPGRSSTSM